MDKNEMANYIKSNYSNLLQKILLAHLDNLKDGKFYGWRMKGKKYRLINCKGNYEIEQVD